MGKYDAFFKDVDQFTKESNEDKDFGSTPRPMKIHEVLFLVKMVLSECFEMIEVEEEYKSIVSKQTMSNDPSVIPFEFFIDQITEKNKIVGRKLIDLVETVIKEKSTVDKSTSHFQPQTLSKDLDVERLSGQADAAADIIYYIANAFSKIRTNLGPVLEEVHRANMDKRDTTSGKFIRNQEGKIQKPPNYKPADVKSVIKKQT